MIGWSRLNDLALQIYAYVPDRTQACDVLRLMNAANHLCYGDLAGKDMMPVCIRRHLLTEAEAKKLRAGGAPPFYLASCWALAKLADPKAPQPVDRMALHRMDLSIIEWRQQVGSLAPSPALPPGRLLSHSHAHMHTLMPHADASCPCRTARWCARGVDAPSVVFAVADDAPPHDPDEPAPVPLLPQYGPTAHRLRARRGAQDLAAGFRQPRTAREAHRDDDRLSPFRLHLVRARTALQPAQMPRTHAHTPRICTAPGCLHSRVHTAPRLMPSRLMPARPTPSRLMPSLYVGVGRLLCQSLWITSISLLMPWRPDGQRAGSTINLPAEYFIMLPLAGHRRLFEAYGPEGDAPEAERSSSIFLRPFHRDDADHLAKFRTTDSWKMMQILHASFRELAPGDGTAAAAAAHATTVEIGPVEDPSQRAVYRLMRNSGERCTSPHMLDD